MIEFDDDRWTSFEGGNKIAYDPRDALQSLLESKSQIAIDQLWENLYHQGDVGLASYAAIPYLVEAGETSLVAAIEVARLKPTNPKLPEWLKDGYFEAIDKALTVQPKTEDECIAYYTLHASKHGHHRLARALDLLDPEELLETYG